MDGSAVHASIANSSDSVRGDFAANDQRVDGGPVHPTASGPNARRVGRVALGAPVPTREVCMALAYKSGQQYSQVTRGHGAPTLRISRPQALFDALLFELARQRPAVHPQPPRRFGDIEIRLRQHRVNVLPL